MTDLQAQGGEDGPSQGKKQEEESIIGHPYGKRGKHALNIGRIATGLQQHPDCKHSKRHKNKLMTWRKKSIKVGGKKIKNALLEKKGLKV